MTLTMLTIIVTTCLLSVQAALASSTNASMRSQARLWETVISLPHAYHRSFLGERHAHRFWRRRLRAVMRVAVNPPHKSSWLCIHAGEGSWQDSGDPYWGGLQMDRGFMHTYAPTVLLRKGYANVWTPLEQMWVAERAFRSGRGFGPWPNTARACGLL